MDKALLVVDGVSFRVARRRAETPSIVVGDVGDETAECRGFSSILVDTGEKLSSRLLVSRPAEPTGVSSIEIHGDVGKVKLGDGVLGQAKISVLGLGTFGNVEISDKVGKRVGL